jgi:diguanylate cyclase (GGDEF)-like protein
MELSRGTDQCDFRALIDDWSEETAFFDPSCRCAYVNAAALAAWGGRETVLRRTPAEIWPDSFHAAFFQARLSDALTSGRPSSFEIDLGAPPRRRSAQLFPARDGAGVFVIAKDLSEREDNQRTQQRLNRALRLLSACNQTLVHATAEQTLLDDICRLIVDSGGYRMAWVGYAQDDADRTVRPAAVAGVEQNYLQNVRISWADDEYGRGPTGTAVRTGATVVNPDFLTESTARPWREAATLRGYRSSVALPLSEEGRTFGALTIYAVEAGAFIGEEIKLLEELAGDLAFGVATLRSRARRDAAEARLVFLAGHDPLTELPNRLTLREKFAAMTAGGDPAALLFIDVDNFKHINDGFDHEAGDRLLTAMAARLNVAVGDDGAVGRAGGDEFVALLPAADRAAASEIAERLLRAAAVPIGLQDGDVALSVSIGAALHPGDGKDFDTLLKRADAALRRAKEQGPADCCFFEPRMDEDAAARWRLYADLRRGLENNEFLLHYQPQVAAADGRIVGVEALARWRPAGTEGPVAPSVFIPAAEQSGLIVPLGEWVLNEACAQAAKWRRDGVADLTMAVNLSAIQFRRADVARTVQAALERSGLPPDRLELELTESVLLDDTETVRAAIAALKERGVRFSIDDFGAGYSSLSYLKRLAVDKLKIDQSFVRDLPTTADDRESDEGAVIKAIIRLGTTLRLTVIAEGVETAAQRDFLTEQGCHQFQGYLFSRPLPAEDCAVFLKNTQF